MRDRKESKYLLWVKVLGFIAANGVFSLLIDVGGLNVNGVL